MISISATEQNTTYGNLLFKESPLSSLGEVSARVSRVATLDGGVYLQYGGYAEGDRTLRIKAYLTEAEKIKLTNMLSNYTSTLISFADGLFLGAIQSINVNLKLTSIVYLLDSKETN